MLVLSGAAAQRLAELVPAGYEPELMLSMTDEPPYAFAQVFISVRAG